MTRNRRSAVAALAAIAIIGLAPLTAAAAEEGQPSARMLYREGARLWPSYCGQCHKARPGGEYSPAEWDTVIMHMRTRANLSGEQARAILQFLKSR